jgi:DoxX-like family
MPFNQLARPWVARAICRSPPWPFDMLMEVEKHYMQAIAREHTFTVRHAEHGSKLGLWVGRGLGWFAALFLLADGAGKIIQPQPVIDGTVQLGYPPDILLTLGIVQLVCVLAYLVPRTSVLGALLLTGYLGGAVATHARVGDPLFTHTLFPGYVGALLWSGLVVRDGQLRALLPFRRHHE